MIRAIKVVRVIKVIRARVTRVTEVMAGLTLKGLLELEDLLCYSGY